MEPEVTLSELADDPAARVALEGLSAFNAPFVGPHGFKPLSLVVRREPGGPPAGGAFGWCYGAWYFLRYLYLPEDLRGGGLGARLIALLEAEARARGCIGAWIDTFSFQARPFYEKQGYAVFGTLEDQPPGHARHFLFKRFT
ncbi:GNAT family N-acetyltransferase [Roseomonas rosulenta]|uniref:GNAT family N-acetyltransferase n=1 Tax=Roseomonas rosulenta TaxID=2748667 RepID=UPI0018DFF0A3|nr:GNAT family N-acetyltransferase [Roseomonas rosulenta]